ncbi:hypothetical protein FPZ41_16425 [Streptomyces sp. K1PN6]|uniref:Uncharacterized protein n=1 Tax=Streptomyces acidicola TaxID=2596892 RepID=A0A5N8WRR8_9ACTN|nr:hypothetical protein [Streptomyces acidicola]
MREPTTGTQVTRRAVRARTARAGNETWGVVRSLREIASRCRHWGRSHPVGELCRLAGIHRSPGIFFECRSSFCTGFGGSIDRRRACRAQAA